MSAGRPVRVRLHNGVNLPLDAFIWQAGHETRRNTGMQINPGLGLSWLEIHIAELTIPRPLDHHIDSRTTV